MAKRKVTPRATGRSSKAPRSRAASAQRPAVKRRRRSAAAAVKKDTTVMQTDAGTKLLWGANQRRPSKV
jgi:hypothetical protein